MVAHAIVGLGNPGKQYAGTRHNIGWEAIDALAARAAGATWRERFAGQAAEVRLAGQPVLLLKPQTYMNGSGAAVQAAMAHHRLAPAAVLVVVDDIHLPLGALRLRATGSAGGHNGLRDIEARIGADYARLRLGVGGCPDPAQQVAWVLGRFAAGERADADLLVAKAADCCLAWLTEGVEVACRFNGPLRPPPPRPRPAPAAQDGPVPPGPPPGAG